MPNESTNQTIALLSRERDRHRRNAIDALEALVRSANHALTDLRSDAPTPWVRTNVVGQPLHPDAQAFQDAVRELTVYNTMRGCVGIIETNADVEDALG